MKTDGLPRAFGPKNDEGFRVCGVSVGGHFIMALDANNGSRYALSMITSFRCPDTERLFNGLRVARFVAIEGVAIRKLQQLHAAMSLDFLRAPPGNRLEKLAGDRAGQWSIRINDQWRVCFCFEAGEATDVEIVDYH
jgi:proteic killer suppression protein